MPSPVGLRDSVWPAQAADWDHRHVLVDMSNSKGRETCHCAVNCACGQICAKFSVVAVGGHCPDHISWVDILQSGIQLLLLEVGDDLSFQKDSDILSKIDSTGSLMFPDWSF